MENILTNTVMKWLKMPAKTGSINKCSNFSGVFLFICRGHTEPGIGYPPDSSEPEFLL